MKKQNQKGTQEEKNLKAEQVRDIFKTKIVENPHLKRVKKSDQRQQIIPGLSTNGQLALL